MVGVRRSKGCSTCITRKIKCDGERPMCLRCIDAKFCCPGYLKALKFQDEGIKLRGVNFSERMDKNASSKRKSPRKSLPNSSLGYQPIRAHEDIQSMPTSLADRLAGQLCETFVPNLPRGTSLSIFGFVAEVPRHIGSDKVLDLSVEAVCIAHRALLYKDTGSLERSRLSYGKALALMRGSLTHGDHSSNTTLCASALLGIYELVTSTDKATPLYHVGGASAILRSNGPGYGEGDLAHKMLKSMKGIIVIEAIILQKRCFLDSSKWRALSDAGISGPFDLLFSTLLKLPGILVSLRDGREMIRCSDSSLPPILKQAENLRKEMQTWRRTSTYQEMFETTSLPCSKDPSLVVLSYTSNRAAALLCTYAAMSILLNVALSQICDQPQSVCRFQAENAIFVEQIFRSREYSLGYAPLGNYYMNFALRVALDCVATGQLSDAYQSRDGFRELS